MGQRCTALRIETAVLRHCADGDRAGMLAAAARADAAAQALYQLVRELLQPPAPGAARRAGPARRAAGAVRSLGAAQRRGLRLPARGRAATSCRDAVDIAVYRVAQEALTNVMRHAQATTVRLRLARSGDALQLEASDDGCGMDLAVPRRGLGLLGAPGACGGARRRAERCAARRARALRLTLRLPLSGPAGAAPEVVA